MKQLRKNEHKDYDDLSVNPLFGVDANRPSIFIIDPLKDVRTTLKKLFKKNFNIIEASSVEEMKDIIIDHDKLSLIIGDVITVLSREFEVAIKEVLPIDTPLPPLVLILRGEDDFLEKRAIDIGVTDFIYRPFNLPIVKNRLTNIINAYMSKKYLEILKNKEYNNTTKDNQ